MIIQFLTDCFLYLIFPCVVVTCLANIPDTTAESDAEDEEHARAWHANSVNPDSPNYRFK